MTVPRTSTPACKSSRFDVLWPALLIALAGAAAYANSFSCPFIFDDDQAIVQNATIRSLGKIRDVLSPPLDAAGATGRPLVNLSLAINYAISGTQVWSYHALNLAIHILAGLTLFGIVRRTLELWERSRFREKSVGRAEGRILTNSATALAIALLWTLHPLLTESVVFVIQRNEVLCGLFYLLTLYCFIRGNEVERVVFNEVGHVGPNALGSERGQGVWAVLSILACLCGMASKEVMASAPIMVLLYDRTFVSGSFRMAWKGRKRYYLGLAATWLLLAWLVLASRQRYSAVGFGLGVSAWDYLLTQCRAIVIYLKLCIWPYPLVLDYGRGLVHRLSDVALPALGLCALLAATALGLWRNRAWGFLGAWFFLILAPSSSVLPLVTQTIAEHRMYLPLAAVVTLLTVILHRSLGRFFLPIVLAFAAAFGWLTLQRNATYRTEEGIWRDTVAKRPSNERAHQNLGVVLALAGRTAESVTEYEAALRLKPDYADAHLNLGIALDAEGRTAEAIAQYEEALRLKPGYAEASEAFYNLGNDLGAEGRTAEAISQYEEALRLKPDYAEAHDNLGSALSAEGRTTEAIAQYQEALRLRPDYAKAHSNLGVALGAEGRTAEAIAQYREALSLDPDDARFHFNLALALLKIPGGTDEAVAHLKTVLRLQPDNDRARKILAEIGAPEP